MRPTDNAKLNRAVAKRSSLRARTAEGKARQKARRGRSFAHEARLDWQLVLKSKARGPADNAELNKLVATRD
ncbi:hypothetical protein GCM10010435_19480 [Winogradskya consettensis]|uniref:Uncharacterized protein n=1 Tax=Winogradskya consettensis TaxID=113560 RepID=A0A919SV89_9ACTN|nr:hypothetical protein [Actinoplanes consettensis]GIM78274.1 hypothetical protein Aco04nite_59570 [Actinoplanes consettensis]